MRNLIREPLVHFVVLGAALFALYRLSPAAREYDPVSRDIVVSRGRIEALAESYARNAQSPPTPTELDALVENFIREEVLYREALALGLDRDDTVVRRRMRQKYEFLSDDIASPSNAPTDAVLAAYMNEHADRYRIEPVVTFTQVFLDPARHGDRLDTDARRLLAALRAGSANPDAAGERFLLGTRFEELGESAIGTTFGTDFAAGLLRTAPGAWAGPLRSSYGLHLVNIERLDAGGMPDLDSMRERVVQDREESRREALREAQYRELRARYRITIESPAATTTR